MHQTIYRQAQVDKCAEISQGFDFAGQFLANFDGDVIFSD